MKKDIVSCLILTFVLVWGCQLFAYENWNYTIGGYVAWIIFLIIVLLIYQNFSKISRELMPLWFIPVLLFVLRVPSAIAGNLVYGTSLFADKTFWISGSSFLLFFMFYANKTGEKTLMKVFYAISFLILFIQVFQVIFPGYAVFGVYSYEDVLKNALNVNSTSDVAEVRNGIHRYRLECYFITLLTLFHSAQTTFKDLNLKNSICTILLLVSAYLYLTRQIMLVSVFGVFVCFILSNFRLRSGKFSLWIFVTTILLILFFCRNILFEELWEQTIDEADSSNVRVAAAAFFGLKLFDNPIGFFFGYGYPAELENWGFFYRFFTSDVGFIGEAFHCGVVWIVMYFFTLGLIIRYRRYIPPYILSYFFSTVLISVFIFPYRSMYEYAVWTVGIFISSIYIRHAKLYGKH